MSLTESSFIDQIEVLENGTIQAREITIIYRDGIDIARNFTNRFVFAPGQDIPLDNTRLQAIAEAVWTPEVITAYQNAQGDHNV